MYRPGKRMLCFILIVAFVMLIICIFGYKYNLYRENQVRKSSSFKEKVAETNINTTIDKQLLYKHIKKLKRNPKDAKALHEMGVLYSKINDYSIAIATIEESLRIDPSNYGAHISLALVNLKEALGLKKTGVNKEVVNQKLIKAEEISNKAIEKNPNKINAYTLLGDIHTTQGLFEESIEDYKKALSIDNSIDSIHVAIAKLYLKEGKTDLAKYQCEKFLSENNSDSYLVNNFLSKIYGQEGDLAKAIHYLNRVSKTDPDDLSIHARLSLLHIDTGEYDAAINKAEYILDQRPSSEFTNLAAFLKENALLAKRNSSFVSLKQPANRLSDIKNSYYLFAPVKKEEDDIDTKFFEEKLSQSTINSLGEINNAQGNVAALRNNDEILLNDISIDSLREELFNIIKNDTLKVTLDSQNLQKNEHHLVTNFSDKTINIEANYKDSKVVSSYMTNTAKDNNKKTVKMTNTANENGIKTESETIAKIDQKLEGKEDLSTNTKDSSFECILNEFFSIPKEIGNCGLDPFCQVGVPVELVMDFAGCYFDD